MADLIVAAVVVIIVAAAVVYIVKEKKHGTKCIGCPSSSTCAHNCKACAGSCSAHTDKKE